LAFQTNLKIEELHPKQCGSRSGSRNKNVRFIDTIAGGELSVPNDISIIGCEGADMEAFCDKPLTTVNAPGNDMGAKAMLQILDEIESPATHIHSTTLLDPQLKRRNTTRPVPTHMHNA
jgi:DNA-binding LacI/PurR family transcriptional regulator